MKYSNEMGTARTEMDDFGLWIHLAGNVTEENARGPEANFEAIIDNFAGDFCVLVDRRHLRRIDTGAMDVFKSMIRKYAPHRLKQLSIVYDSRILRPQIELETLPPDIRNVVCYIDGGLAPDWKAEAMQWIRTGTAPEHAGPCGNVSKCEDSALEAMPAQDVSTPLSCGKLQSTLRTG